MQWSYDFVMHMLRFIDCTQLNRIVYVELYISLILRQDMTDLNETFQGFNRLHISLYDQMQ